MKYQLQDKVWVDGPCYETDLDEYLLNPDSPVLFGQRVYNYWSGVIYDYHPDTKTYFVLGMGSDTMAVVTDECCLKPVCYGNCKQCDAAGICDPSVNDGRCPSCDADDCSAEQPKDPKGTKKCECGATACGMPYHSDWCPIAKMTETVVETPDAYVTCHKYHT